MIAIKACVYDASIMTSGQRDNSYIIYLELIGVIERLEECLRLVCYLNQNSIHVYATFCLFSKSLTNDVS